MDQDLEPAFFLLKDSEQQAIKVMVQLDPDFRILLDMRKLKF